MGYDTRRILEQAGKEEPSILTHKVVMKPENFKAFFEQVWDKASEQRASQQKFYETFPWMK